MKRKRETIKEQATAYHEAGHAVVAFFLGVGFRKKTLTIIPDKTSAGSFQHHTAFPGINPEWDNSGRARLQAEKSVMISLAGGAAQKRFSQQSYRSWQNRGDRENAIDVLTHFVGDSAELTAYYRLLEIRTKNMLNRPGVWPCIEDLAQGLLKKKTLSAKEAKTSIQATMTNLVNARKRK